MNFHLEKLFIMIEINRLLVGIKPTYSQKMIQISDLLSNHSVTKFLLSDWQIAYIWFNTQGTTPSKLRKFINFTEKIKFGEKFWKSQKKSQKIKCPDLELIINNSLFFQFFHYLFLSFIVFTFEARGYKNLLYTQLIIPSFFPIIKH